MKCWCTTCRPISIDPPEDMRFVVCPQCGNKRCPRANNHELDCTNSNAIGQPGSSWDFERMKNAVESPSIKIPNGLTHEEIIQFILSHKG